MASRTVLITGASSGIGRAFAHLFARDAYRVVLTARHATTLETLRSALVAMYKADAHVINVDLATEGGADLLHAQLLHDRLSVDVLVNNAGFGMQGNFVELPLERQLQMMTLNMTSLVALTRLLAPAMVQRRHGGVINVASTAGFQPGPLMAVYYATKAFVVSFTEAISDELKDSGVVVTCLAPGPTSTGFATEAGVTHAPLFQGEVMTADEVARIGYEGWRHGKSLVIAGARNRRRYWLVKILPRGVVRRAVRALNSKAEA
jgi:short-subunit dehydrogenase